MARWLKNCARHKVVKRPPVKQEHPERSDSARFWGQGLGLAGLTAGMARDAPRSGRQRICDSTTVRAGKLHLLDRAVN